jgi:hypothetical protein
MKIAISISMLLAATLSLPASLTSVVGSGDILTSGPGVGYTTDFFGDPTLVIHGWNEVQNYTLPANLAVNITTLGTFNSTASLTPGFIPAGTVINSHVFFYDPAIGGSTVAAFQFDTPILGVIVDDGTPPDLLLTSDFLIPGTMPSVNIPTTHFAARGIELGINIDHLNVSATGVQLFLSAGSPGDQLRVITAAPEPNAAALLAVGATLIATRRRSLTAR